MFAWFRRLFDPTPPPAKAGGLNVAELCRRLDVDEATLRGTPVEYRAFEVPKRTGGTRTIHAPAAPLKALQRRVLRRLLARLSAHAAATAYERGQSIATHAARHVGRAVVVKLDLHDFFGSTPARRVDDYFRTIGWDADAAGLLARLCTHGGALPQGAPTSPRLSNLVNVRLDARLAALAGRFGATYSRYADDLTFSCPESAPIPLRSIAVYKQAGLLQRWEQTGSIAPPPRIADRVPNLLVNAAGFIVEDEGYRLHRRKKLVIARSHQRQVVTGLVVNDRLNLPRRTRRLLRAVEHRKATGRAATMTDERLAGWRALRRMVEAQRDRPADGGAG